MNQSKIILDDLIKIYKRGKIEVVALRGLSCEFKAGEITVVMGPSGCGKTTLLNMIGGLDRVNSGKMIVDGQDIAQFNDRQLEEYRRHKVGIVFQFLNLIPELTAEENIYLPLDLAGNLGNEQKAFIQELLDLVGLQDRKTHRPDELSGGEQQRIGIAAALANNPEIILCDEPTGELDTQSKKIILQLLRSLIEKFPNKAMIIVTHDPTLKEIADRMYYIRDGQISYQFNKEELQTSQQAGSTPTGMMEMKGLGEEEINKRVLFELREINHIVKDRIEKIEKKIHPE